MKKEEKTRRFREQSERDKIVNRNMMIAISTILFVMILSCINMLAKGEQSITRLITIASSTGIIMLTDLALYMRDKQSQKLRYYVLGSFLIIYFPYVYFGVGNYVSYGIVPALLVTVLFYDVKFTKIMYLIGMIDYTALIIYKVIENGDTVYLQELFTIYVTVAIIYSTIVFGQKFIKDITYSLVDEQEKQKDIIEDIINISKVVREESVRIKEIVDKLEKSTEVVNEEVADISKSALSSSESIEEQSIMTKSIQDNIHSTLNHTQQVMKLADQSKELIVNSQNTMSNLTTQSQTISETNRQVTDSMVKLQERTKEVQVITNMIFEISNKTNLLALNASIESARAGEAGRGFAVVAEEIRELAEQTRKSTENISNIVEELNRNAVEVEVNVKGSIKATDEQENIVYDAAQYYRDISDNITELHEKIELVSNMLSDVSVHNDRIVNSISQLSATSDEITASSKEAALVSEESKKDANVAKTSLDCVLEIVNQMDKYM